MTNTTPVHELAVEAHLAECAACRSEIVQLRGIVRPPRSTRRGLILGVAAAAALVLLVALPRDAGPPISPGDPARADSIAQSIRALGAVAQPPIYLGVAVRAATPVATEQFSNGMRAYADARYADVVAALKGGRAAGIEGVATPFFLGASLLMLDDASGAAEEFARVIAMGETAYRSEAHYYRAKALLRLNQPADAAAELDRSVRSGVDPIKGAAQSLLDSLRVLRER